MQDRSDHYRRRMEDLGKRLIAAEERRRLAQIEADRTSKILGLMRRAHDIADSASDTKAFSLQYLAQLCGLMLTDGAAILMADPDGGGVHGLHEFGAATPVDRLPVSGKLPDFDYLNDCNAGSEIVAALAAHLGQRHLAWSWNTADRIGLVLIRQPFNAAQLPFSPADREVMQSALSIYSEALKRRLARDALVAAKRAAEKANRAKSEFLSTMSHELRTPLNAINGFSQMMQREVFGPLGNPHYLDYARFIHESGEHLLSLINDVLDMSRIEAGRMPLHEEALCLSTTIGTTVQLMRDQAKDHGLVLMAGLPADLPALWADRRAMKQMMINLLSNAIKFTPRGGEIQVAAEREAGGGLILSVADTGIGIPEEDQAVVLEPFRQGRSSALAGESGTGLGLSLVKALIEMHDGRLTLTSRPGEGTTVNLYFPESRLCPTDRTETGTG
ncbi:MAG: hypothetical protein GVY13_14140 [Alphaproteobacteria bacterium]|nr:hypothetical protein [Alphaproteobacteria bacterium]